MAQHQVTLVDEDGESTVYYGATEYEAVLAAWNSIRCDFGPLAEQPADLDDFTGACIDSGVFCDVLYEFVE